MGGHSGHEHFSPAGFGLVSCHLFKEAKEHDIKGAVPSGARGSFVDQDPFGGADGKIHSRQNNILADWLSCPD